MQPVAALRLFLAITFPEEVRRQLARFTQPFQLGLPGVRFVAAESLHITLAFLGECPPEEPARIAAALGEVWPRHSAFPLSFGQTGCFPHRTAPRVLWIGIDDGREPLLALQQDITAALVRHVLFTPRERFRPHLTIARIDDHADPRQAGDLAARWLAGTAAGLPPVAVQRVHLMRSELLRVGPRYTTLQSWSVAGVPASPS